MKSARDSKVGTLSELILHRFKFRLADIAELG
jgi:hypothetical protein